MTSTPIEANSSPRMAHRLLLSPAEVARLIGIAPKTLEAWRTQARAGLARGPAWLELPGRRVAYLRSDLIEWLIRHRRVPRSTPLTAAEAREMIESDLPDEACPDE